MLANAPQLQAVTILPKLQDDHPGEYRDSTRRTLERRVRHWRATSGSPKEVFFPQLHEPGARGLSDFTDMAELRVTIAGVPFEHRLYHFVLAFSRWEYAMLLKVARASKHVQGTAKRTLAGWGMSARASTDSLSAAFRNLADEDDFAVRYAALLEHYGMTGTRNNRGLGHENGSVESSHRYLKEAIDQALMLRGHRDFIDRAAYDEFLREVVMRRNRRNAAAFRLEREQLMDLPLRRTRDFVEEEARVTRCSTFTVRGILYSAPSRLIGHRLKVRVNGDRLDWYLSGALVHITSRGSRGGDNRHALNYRHFIESLKRKLQSHRWISAHESRACAARVHASVDGCTRRGCLPGPSL
ncbi:hypothetical protein QF000_000716 [Paraburkholderia atlantica]